MADEIKALLNNIRYDAALNTFEHYDDGTWVPFSQQPPLEYPKRDTQDLYQRGFNEGYKQASESAARIIDFLFDKIKKLEADVTAHKQGGRYED